MEDFNPRSPHGERRRDAAESGNHPGDFNPRSPHGERQRSCTSWEGKAIFQSTLPARGATQCPKGRKCKMSISIHAPRTGSDDDTAQSGARARHFNPRSPHGERRDGTALPCRQAHFNPRSPHGERLIRVVLLFKFVQNFNPRSPHGERLDSWERAKKVPRISIHAPRTGSDKSAGSSTSWHSHFNPRSPHGERLCEAHRQYAALYFNPRSPHGERPKAERRMRQERKISIHAPRTGSDISFAARIVSVSKFQSTLPARGATNKTTRLEGKQ